MLRRGKKPHIAKNVSWHSSCKIVSRRTKHYPDFRILKVNAEHGPLKTIPDALAVATPHSTIKVSSGLYRENIYIT